MAAAKVYTKQLYARGNGRALYVPEDEINVGDVGFFEATDGRFNRLFNCTLPADHEINAQLGVPDGYEPFELHPKHCRFNDDFLPPQAIVSNSVVSSDISADVSAASAVSAGAGMSYKCIDEQGAVLLFGSRLARADIRDNTTIRSYMQLHVDSWYDHANGNGFGPEQVPEGSIVLVRGCDKTPSFALAAFWKKSKEASISFQGGFVQTGGVRLQLQGCWEETDAAEYRIGRSPLFDSDSTVLKPPMNGDGHSRYPFFSSDCVHTAFVRVYKIKRSRKRLGLRIPLKIEAGAGPHQLPRSPPSDDSGGTVAVNGQLGNRSDSDESTSINLAQQTDLCYHPLDDVLNYILEHSADVELAIASDQDIYSLTLDVALLDDIPNLLKTVRPHIELLRQGVGQLAGCPTREITPLLSPTGMPNITPAWSTRSALTSRGSIAPSSSGYVSPERSRSWMFQSRPRAIPVASAMSEKARLTAARAASSLSPSSTNGTISKTTLSPKRLAMLANRADDEYNPLSQAVFSSISSSPSNHSVDSASIFNGASQSNTRSAFTALTSTRFSASRSQCSLPRHAISPLDALTPNPLLFRSDVPIPPAPQQSSQLDTISPFPLNNPYARSQPPGMLGNAYQTTPAPVIERPPEPTRCAPNKHDFHTHYGVVGIMTSIICFPLGLAGLFFDRDRSCRRCGLRTDRHGNPLRPS